MLQNTKGLKKRQRSINFILTNIKKGMIVIGMIVIIAFKVEATNHLSSKQMLSFFHILMKEETHQSSNAILPSI